MNCKKCGATLPEGSLYCTVCGSPVSSSTNFLMVTTPTVPGYKIKQVLGLVTGLTPRTRGALGKFIAGFQSMFGGEVTGRISDLPTTAELIDTIVEDAIKVLEQLPGKVLKS